MSGVFGVIDTRQHDGATGLVAAMGAALRHRDWYVVETHTDVAHGAALGRVGIGVFNRVAQPVRSADGTRMMCFAASSTVRARCGRSWRVPG